MLINFQNHLNKNLAFLKGKKLLLATSGGVDSMVMAELLRLSGFDIALAHCNFNLRGSESDGDEKFVAAYAKKNKITFHSINFNTEAFAKDNVLSIQVAARQLRYVWFQELLEKPGFDYLLTAHHADDNLETFLINLSRGTGIDGLTGIPQQNGKIVRPLLVFSRAEIEDYAKENHIKWREDSSNASDKYLRNKIRHDLIPALKNPNPNFLNSFQLTLARLQETQTMADDAAIMVYQRVAKQNGNAIHFDLSELHKLPNYHSYLYYWLREFGFSAWHDIYSLTKSQSGKQVFSPTFKLLKDRETLILLPLENVSENETFPIEKDTPEVNFPLNLSFCPVTDSTHGADNCIFVDQDKLEFPLQVRKWRDGDYFYPFGMAGKKKVGKFFKDEKLSLVDKENVWLLCSGNDIVWIVGKRLDDRFKITAATKNILQIKTS